MACKCNLASGQKHRCSSSIVPITSGLEKSPQNRIITPQVVELESVMRCWKSCLCLWWHIDQLYVLRRSWASQAEAARAHKTLLTKLQGKKIRLRKSSFQRERQILVCDSLCLVNTVWMCDDVFELAGGVSQNLWAFLGNKVFESGTTPCQMYDTHTHKNLI